MSSTGTITSLGLGSGLQLQSMLDQLRQADEAPITNMQTQVSGEQQQINEFNNLDQAFLGIKSQALTLNLQSTFIKRDISVGPEGVLSATVSDGADIGTHQITVSQLATASLWQGGGVSAANTVINSSGASQTFSYHVGTGATISVSVPNGTTLQGLADLINQSAGNAGVMASVINDGSATPYHLALKANATGETSRIYIDTQLPNYALTELQGASGASLNAQVTVDGVTYQRGGNTNISDIINGVNLTLLKPGTSSISISSSTSDLESTILSMVDGFNSAIKTLKTDTGYSSNGTPGIFTANSTVRGLTAQFQALLATQINTGGTIKSMYDLGLSVAQDGTISIDKPTLENALANNFNDVQTFFLGKTGVTGFASQLDSSLGNITQAGTGVLALEQNAAQSRITQLNQEINDATARLNEKYDTLTRQYAQLDSFMGTMKSLSSYLTAQFNAFTNTNNNSQTG
ncbi:MAG: flagellar filament capping protein FliD [Desulfobacteraceae bacterium]|nr:flagellar filament capping protein FliD [Desulfobacteraceae bacterium]